MPKERVKRGKHNPLADDLNADRFVVQGAIAKGAAARSVGGRRAGAAAPDAAAEDDDAKELGTYVMTERAGRRIMEASRRGVADDEEYVSGGEDEDAFVGGNDAAEEDFDEMMPAPDAPGFQAGDEDGEQAESEVDLEYDDHESIATEMEDFGDLGDDFGIDDEEERLLQKFQPQTQMRSRNLADIIMAKIKEKETGTKAADDDDDGTASNASTIGFSKIDPRVRKVYVAIGKVLKSYTSGKIPKAFKVLPHIHNWEALLMLTKPQDWSPHATYSATRIFAAHLNEKMAQRFYSAVLLPICHEAMAEARKLHPAMFNAVKKALFKPVAFYKGFLLPLVMEEECSLRMALAIGAVLQKMHLPPVPTAVAIVKISTLPFSSANSLFLRVFIDKKMALPFQAIDALVKHFHRFCSSHGPEEALPVLWHQTFLSFCQHYKMDLTAEQISLLKQVCTRHFHHLITPEIRRELAAADKALKGIK